MVNSEIVLPLTGDIVRLSRGMKSGWLMTATDNSIIHMLLFETFKELTKEYGLEYLTYGDDILIG